MEYNNDCAIRLSKLERRQKDSRGVPVHLLGRMLQFAMHDLDGKLDGSVRYICKQPDLSFAF